MSYLTDNSSRYQGVRLCSPRDEESSWLQYKFSMRLVLKVQNLWYLVEGSVKMEDGLPASTTVVAGDENIFGALLIDSVHNDNIDLIVEATTARTLWRNLEAAHHHTSAGT